MTCGDHVPLAGIGNARCLCRALGTPTAFRDLSETDHAAYDARNLINSKDFVASKAARTMPDPILLVLRYMHILGAITLMGGTIFMRFGLAPVVAGLDDAARSSLHQQVRARWSKLVMIASGLLLLSGIANLALASRFTYEGALGEKYHMIVGIKFLLALPIFLIASFLAGRSSTAQKFQSQATTWMNVNLALALVMVLIGGALKFVPRTPKVQSEPAATSSVPEPHLVASQMLSFRRAAE